MFSPQSCFAQAFSCFGCQIVNIVFGQRPHEGPHNLGFVGVAEVLGRGDQLHALFFQPGFQVHVLPQAPGDTVVFVNEDGIKGALVAVPQHPLILPPLGRLGALAADGFIRIDFHDGKPMAAGILPAGPHLGFYAVLCLFIRRKPGINHGFPHGFTFFSLL